VARFDEDQKLPCVISHDGRMFRHILLPTDGSRLAARGVKAGVKLAKALGARVTALHVIPPYVPPFGDALVHIPAMSGSEHKKACERTAKKVLAQVESAARKAGVACAGVSVTDPQPWGGILRIARSKRCDAIVMASHGRGGLGGLLLGSETQRVLAHSKIPVLVTR
jgi:nucleotide-binding universal stress UspA family protein